MPRSYSFDHYTVPEGEADYLIVLDETQIERNRPLLKPQGILIGPGRLAGHRLPSPKSLNVALLGVLSRRLDFAQEAWSEAIRGHLTEKLIDLNLEAFRIGRVV